MAFHNGRRAPVVRVMSPNGSETLPIDHAWAIEWIAASDAGVTAVDLSYPVRASLVRFEPIAMGLKNTGKYEWTVEGPEARNAFVKVVAHDAAQHSERTSAISPSLSRSTIPRGSVKDPPWATR